MPGKLSITFDDGLESVYSIGLPELERVGVPATVFVISGLIGKKYQGRPVMTKQMLRSLGSKGWEIGSHTLTHPNLTELPDSQLTKELKDSKKNLEEITSNNVVSLAYPFGAFDNRVKAIAARHYTFARSVSCYPPLRVNGLSPDFLELTAMSTYERAFALPLHLFSNHIAQRISYRPRTRNSPANVINSSRKGLEARFVRKWVRKLHKNRWLILCFHNISTNTTPSSYTVALEEFREIAKVIVKNAEVVNLREGLQTP